MTECLGLFCLVQTFITALDNQNPAKYHRVRQPPDCPAARKELLLQGEALSTPLRCPFLLVRSGHCSSPLPPEAPVCEVLRFTTVACARLSAAVLVRVDVLSLFVSTRHIYTGDTILARVGCHINFEIEEQKLRPSRLSNSSYLSALNSYPQTGLYDPADFPTGTIIYPRAQETGQAPKQRKWCRAVVSTNVYTQEYISYVLRY